MLIRAALRPTAVTTIAKMAGATAIARPDAAIRRRSGLSAFQAAGPHMRIVPQRALLAQRPCAAVIRAMRAIWTAMATVWAASRARHVHPGSFGGTLIFIRVPSAMTDVEHLWACALAIETQHGTGPPLHVAEWIGALALVRDTAGFARWQTLAPCLAALRGASAQGWLRGGLPRFAPIAWWRRLHVARGPSPLVAFLRVRSPHAVNPIRGSPSRTAR